MVDEATGQCKLSPESCRGFFPNITNDHGAHCAGCNQTDCLVWLEEECPDGFVFNNRKMQCVSCQEEFGNETVVCDNNGALECKTNYFPTVVEVDANISNLHCNSCSELIPNCDKCLTSDICVKCSDDEYYQVSADGKMCTEKVKNDPIECNSLHQYPEDDHNHICMKCTKSECLDWIEYQCGEGYVYNSKIMFCFPCASEFGEGTLTCNGSGALTCQNAYYRELVNVTNSTIQNYHCK